MNPVLKAADAFAEKAEQAQQISFLSKSNKNRRDAQEMASAVKELDKEIQKLKEMIKQP